MKVGFCNGCFDLFHDGHRLFLNKATYQCDYLVVAVNSDESVTLRKGKDRPHWHLGPRMAAVHGYLNRISAKHAVIPFDGYEGALLVSIRPDVYFQGYDHGGGLDDPHRKLGVPIVRIEQLPGVSTTLLSKAER